MVDSEDKLDSELISGDELVKIFDALSHPMRIKIMATLKEHRQHVSELARMVNISRPLLYMHLQKLESAKLVKSSMEISEGGKAMKFYAAVEFEILVNPKLLTAASESIQE
ncbi:MAG: winged helix-turn-helix domain-containing protein [Bacteroidota bacterium]|nr:winged helix-turn-helix domain-containing protein [Bacteroidota bacterium]